jgi:Tol biopolymer transport system component/predicted Ser/Thr protein kinase
MDPERWQLIDRLYNSARMLEPGLRTRFLNEACAGDKSLFEAIESLLASDERAGDFLELPALGVLAGKLAREQPRVLKPDLAGHTLLHYRIEQRIGEGGMGVVYRAHDEHLVRDVAIKVITAGYLGDHAARKRFRQEALALSKLNHPNIETVFDFSTQEGIDFLVMEYIPGTTLKERIAGGPLPEKEIAHLGLQLAEGLTAAHLQGIVHRDLKPGNIMITPDDRLKILDFGLAKLMEPEGLEGRRDRSTTSQPGAGTLTYMAPEQLSGKLVDHRTDIYGAGTILYEMTTGRHPFQGQVVGSLIDDILHRLPVPPSQFRSAISSRLEEIILKCLEKDPEDRYQSSRDLQIDLRRLCGSTDPRMLPYPVPKPRPRLRYLWAAGAIVALILCVLAVLWIIPGEGPAPPSGHPLQVTKAESWEGEPAISPDGGRIAYSSNEAGNLQIYVVDVHGGTPLRLTSDKANNEEPAWFPDGSAIAFASDRGGKHGIWKTGQLGGDPMPMIENAIHPAISHDGTQVAFSRQIEGGSLRIGVAPIADPSRARILTGGDGGLWDHEYPAWSPDGRMICYTSRHGLWLVPSAGGKARPLTAGDRDFDPVWSPDGRHVYFASYREGTVALWRVNASGGSPERITLGTASEAHPSVSRDGARLAYSTGMPAGMPSRWVVVLDRDTGAEAPITDRKTEFMAAVSPDKKQIVLTSDRYGPYFDLWLQPLSHGKPSGAARRLVSQGGNLSHPVFSPDGRWIAYYGILGEQRDIWTVSVEGGEPIRFTEDPAPDYQPFWSPDSSQLAFVSERDGRQQIYLEAIRDGRPAGPPRRLETGGVACEAPAWSPDGKQIAFIGVSNDKTEVYVVPVEGSSTPRQVTAGAHAWRVRWDGPTGNLLVSGNWGENTVSLRRVMLRGGPPIPLEHPVIFGPGNAVGLFDVSPDGRLVVYSRERLTGDIWLLEGKTGVF